MNPEQVTQIKEALAPLTEKLGQGAEFVYETYVRQAIMQGVIQVSIAALFLIVVLLAATKGRVWITKKIAAENAKSYGDPELFLGGGIFVGLVCLALLCVAVGLISDGVMHLTNPHYYAIKDLVASVRG